MRYSQIWQNLRSCGYLCFSWFFICSDHITDHLKTLSLRMMKMFNSMRPEILGKLCRKVT